MTYRGESITVAPPEYVILRKLEYFREGGSDKHLRDIRAMLAVSGDQLDRPALEEWLQRQGLAAEWARVSASSIAVLVELTVDFVDGGEQFSFVLRQEFALFLSQLGDTGLHG